MRVEEKNVPSDAASYISGRNIRIDGCGRGM